MERIIRKSETGICFMDLLLDERLCEGIIWIPVELVQAVGGVNKRLPAKQKYELLLRIVSDCPVELCLAERMQEENPGQWCRMEDDRECSGEGWRTDCYVVGKYSAQLREAGYFDAVVQALLVQAREQKRETVTMQFLAQMIGKEEAYYRIDDAVRPILIYKGDTICHNVLNVFAEQFGSALMRAGEQVEYFDTGKEDWMEIVRYKGKRYKAVIGVQTYLFSVKMKDGVHFLHEYIAGPKYNFLFDHPIWMKNHLYQMLPDLTVLTHDANYVRFIERYYHIPARLFPPAGMEPERTEGEEKRKCYDLSFVGTYGNYLSQVKEIHQMERRKRFLANRLLLLLRKNPDMTLEAGFSAVLKERGIQLTDEEYLEQLYELRKVSYCVSFYYRDRALKSILAGGIRVDAFGDSWAGCPLNAFPNLICHPDVTVEESLEIYRKSRISLNIMSWHKGGFTERMASIMLAGAVLLTDDSAYLHGRYDAGEIEVFHLNALDGLADQIKELLKDEVRLRQMAENGRKRAMEEHTWDVRAAEFQKLLQDF